ncbi:MAG: GFA family protein [Sphingomonadaceae bacterium]|nr:GFA family protein [Sphingomonadaceae bacterium]MBJ7389111.1 GFA family protein [Sphingomonadaceae bacterium]MBJ7527014.1 GFA family protein [Sphingomonadaceae bacterium]
MAEHLNQSEFLNCACHCGAVQFIVKLSDEFNNARRCDCSLCQMRGAVVASANREDIQITAGSEHMKLYRFNTMQAEHHFCGICGIYTYHLRRSNPDEISINVACIEGVSPFDFPRIPVYDGQTHHNDRPGGAAYRIAGYLSYKTV